MSSCSHVCELLSVTVGDVFWSSMMVMTGEQSGDFNGLNISSWGGLMSHVCHTQSIFFLNKICLNQY